MEFPTAPSDIIMTLVCVPHPSHTPTKPQSMALMLFLVYSYYIINSSNSLVCIAVYVHVSAPNHACVVLTWYILFTKNLSAVDC